MHWFPAPTKAAVVEVVDGGPIAVVVVVLEEVVGDRAGALGAEARLGVPEQPVARSARADTVRKLASSRFTC